MGPLDIHGLQLTQTQRGRDKREDTLLIQRRLYMNASRLHIIIIIVHIMFVGQNTARLMTVLSRLPVKLSVAAHAHIIDKDDRRLKSQL